MSRLTKALVVTIVVVGLSTVAPAVARAGGIIIPSIGFSDLTEGAPNPYVSAGIDVVAGSYQSRPEYAAFDAYLHIPFGQGVLNYPAGPSLFVLTEGPDPSFISDWLMVETPQGYGGDGPVDWMQFIHVTFSSDSEVPLPPFPYAPTCSLVENGGWQTCGLYSQTGDRILDLNIQSDMDVVPDPGSTLLLLGMGLLGLRAWGKRR